MRLFATSIARNLRQPQKGIIGYYVTRFLKKQNAFLEPKAVTLCDLEPHHHVLEVGFGPGLGLKTAAEQIKKGEGMVHGIDFSPAMISEAMKLLKDEIADDRVQLTLGNAERLPYGDASMDRIFHVNCYYFWPDTKLVARELLRALRPGGCMVTLMYPEVLQWADSIGYMQFGHRWRPDVYMDALKAVGFVDVHAKDEEEGKHKFKTILAQKSE